MTGTSLIMARGRFQGYQGSPAGFRRSHQGVNGVLTGSLCGVSGAVGLDLGKASYG
jgi:hypothetical protein